jgi:hypothetical protein
LRDSINTKYAENIDVKFNMLSAKELGQKGSILGGVITTIVIIVVLLVIFIRRLRHKAIELIKKIISKFKK